MKLAIEYIKRTGLSQNLLRLPCSLFLEDIFNKNRLVLTIQSCWGKPDEAMVKHWHLDRVMKDNVLPPFEEFIINKKEIFNSPLVVIDNYKPVDYAVNSYPILHKQLADEPYATQQEKTYQTCLDRFFNSTSHESKKTTWLWNSFVNSFFTESMKSEFGFLPNDVQMDSVKRLCPIPWKVWKMWIKQMFMDANSLMATELAVSTSYEDKLAKNEKYQSQLAEKRKCVPDNYFKIMFT